MAIEAAPGAAAPAGPLAIDPSNPAQPPGSEPAPPPEQQTPPATDGEAPAGDQATDDDDIQLPDGSVVPRAIAESVRDRYAKERIKRREYEKALEEWGGMDAVREAVDLQKHMQTEDGVVDLFIETARALGIGVDKLESLFQQAEQAGGGESEDDDQLLTLREARQLLAQEVQPRFQQQELERATERARSTVADVLGQLGVEDSDDVTTILQLGDRYLPEGTLDPEKVAAAVRRGHADWLNIVEKRSQEYLKKKAEQAASVPKTPAGGSAPGAEPPEAPKSVDEAKQRVRERLRAMSG